MPRAFVIRPFGIKTDSKQTEIDFELVHDTLIAPALTEAGLSGSTTVEVENAGNIRADMFALILEADLVVCDITVHNANAARDKNKAISRHLADAWLREAEKISGLEPQRGSLWHAYRRKWGTERKHLPDVDVAAAGGWRSLDALKSAYQQVDDATMLKVVLGGGELREAK